MIRVECKPKTGRPFVFCEDTEDRARAEVAAMESAGVEFDDVRYYDRDARLAAIWRGEF